VTGAAPGAGAADRVRVAASAPAVGPASFDLQPTLVGALVALHPLAPTDFDALYAVARDPLIWAQHPAHDRHEEPVFRAFFAEALASGGAFLVCDRADARVIGSTRYHGLDPVRGEVEIGWTFLARSHWGGRHNGEMKRLMLAHAFRFVERVILVIGERNLRSRRAAERIGAVLATPATRADRPGSVVYELTRARFLAPPGPGHRATVGARDGDPERV
jgi:RimJ/RimL family protein N-acetyltransferase